MRNMKVIKVTKDYLCTMASNAGSHRQEEA